LEPSPQSNDFATPDGGGTAAVNLRNPSKNSLHSGSDGMSAPLSVSVLGGIKVARGGSELVLPASKKARALLIYLAMTRRPHRRDRLCAMFWDTPDDPRGALRSSLSKLRAVVDEPDQRRIVAVRDMVRFDAGGVDIDLLAVRRQLVGDLAKLPTGSRRPQRFAANSPKASSWTVVPFSRPGA
jgi:hypothetical protein